jgi:hypothetical protein
MIHIGILSFHRAASLSILTFCELYEDLHPEGQANYIDKHSYVDTHCVSSGGRERMK